MDSELTAGEIIHEGDRGLDNTAVTEGQLLDTTARELFVRMRLGEGDASKYPAEDIAVAAYHDAAALVRVRRELGKAAKK